MRHAFCHRVARCPLTDTLCQFRLELPHGDRQQNCTMTPNACQTMANLMRFLLLADRRRKKLLCHGSRRVDQAAGMLPPLNQETIHVAAASQLNACESQVTHQMEPPRCLCLAYHAPDVCRAA